MIEREHKEAITILTVMSEIDREHRLTIAGSLVNWTHQAMLNKNKDIKKIEDLREEWEKLVSLHCAGIIVDKPLKLLTLDLLAIAITEDLLDYMLFSQSVNDNKKLSEKEKEVLGESKKRHKKTLEKLS
jgi:hypothetical protein